MTDPQDRITEFWSMVAPDYEDHAGNVEEYGSPGYDRWVKAVADILPDTPSDVVDLATGTGYMALIAAGLGHRVTGYDLSPQMVAIAERNAEERGLPVRFGIGDAVAPDLEAGSADVLMNRHLLWTLREPEVAMANWRRILRPGGLVLSVDGFWFADEGPKDEGDPNVFDRHYCPDTRAALPFMPLDDVGPLVEAFEHAGFTYVRAAHAPDLVNRSAGALPHIIVARP